MEITGQIAKPLQGIGKFPEDETCQKQDDSAKYQNFCHFLSGQCFVR
jgi:hypothetical protein